MKNLFVVTGASSGIGAAIALELVKTGNTVIACGRDEKKLQIVISKNSLLLPFVGDLSSAKECDRLIKMVEESGLSLKGLVNNAGAYVPGSFLKTTDEIWLKMFEVNLFSAVRLTRGLFSELKKAQPSSVLNISSTLGLRPVAGTASYSASKAAMVNWTKCLALEWAADQIRVNCICPGLVDTPIHAFHNLEESSKEKMAANKMQPLGRMGTPQEIASAATFLLSEASAWTTGAALSVDGGIGL